MWWSLVAAAAPPTIDDPSSFPIAVWLQQAFNAERYEAVGVNLFVGQWDPLSDDTISTLSAAGMPVLADQNDVGLNHASDPILWGWTQQDEPDNAQPDGNGGYGACVDPSVLQAKYAELKAADPTRPVFLNLGQNVAWPTDTPWYGRGSDCADRWDQYPEYVQAADIVSFDIYPVTSGDALITGNLWYVAAGVDRLVEWSGGTKRVWNAIEASHVGSEVMPTPAQVEAEVWMSLVHGSTGILYFCHEWYPSFSETGCLDDPTMAAGLTAIDAQILSLAPVLNEPSLTTGWSVASSDPYVPVDAMAKVHDGDTWVFAVAMRDAPADGTFTVDGAADGDVEVLDEGRTVPISGGTFTDGFAGYQVHRYPDRGLGPDHERHGAHVLDPFPVVHHAHLAVRHHRRGRRASGRSPDAPTKGGCACDTSSAAGAWVGVAIALVARRRRNR